MPLDSHSVHILRVWILVVIFTSVYMRHHNDRRASKGDIEKTLADFLRSVPESASAMAKAKADSHAKV